MQKEDLILKKMEKLERIPEAIDVIVGRLDGLTGQVGGLTNEVGGLTEKIDVITETVAGVMEKLSDHDKRFDRLETTTFLTNEKVSEIDANVQKLNTDMHGVVETLDAHTHMLLRLDQERLVSYATLERHGEDIAVLKKKTARA